ncbi:hypothetical protein [Sorangium sp. So ce233]|uniref:hypothetical protein n=1 Tax=Sorangium sp. So ce233 TaxID=3133290 RepID=UPI003F61F2F7
MDKIVIESGPIVFPEGVAVGGWSNLAVFRDGAYNFSGHFHVSGALSHTVRIAWALRSNSGVVFMFGNEGRVHGTFEPGSRDHDWNISGRNDAIASAWSDLEAGWTARWDASAKFGFEDILKAVLGPLGAVREVIKVVGF